MILAVAAFDQTIELDPNNAQAYYDKSLALIHLGKNLEAVASLDRLLELIPGFAPAFFQKGVALANAGMYNEAVFSFNIKLEITPRRCRSTLPERNRTRTHGQP